MSKKKFVGIDFAMEEDWTVVSLYENGGLTMIEKKPKPTRLETVLDECERHIFKIEALLGLRKPEVRKSNRRIEHPAN